MPNYGAMTDAYYGRRANRINEGTARRGAEMEGMVKKLAGAAAMGDPGALEQLMQIDPKMGMQIRQSNNTRAQTGLSQQADQQKAIDAALKSSLEYASKYDSPEAAVQGLQNNVDFMSLPEQARNGILQNMSPEMLTSLKKGFGVTPPITYTSVPASDGVQAHQVSSTGKKSADPSVVAVDKPRSAEQQYKLEKDAMETAGKLDTFELANDFLGKVAAADPEVFPDGLKFDSQNTFLQYKKTGAGEKGSRLVVDNGVVTYQSGDVDDSNTISTRTALQRTVLNSRISLSQLDSVQALQDGMGMNASEAFGLTGAYIDWAGDRVRQVPLAGPFTNAMITGLLGDKVKDADIKKIKKLRSEIRIVSGLLVDQIRPITERGGVSQSDRTAALRIISALEAGDTIGDWDEIKNSVRELAQGRLDLAESELGKGDGAVIKKFQKLGYSLKDSRMLAKGVADRVIEVP